LCTVVVVVPTTSRCAWKMHRREPSRWDRRQCTEVGRCWYGTTTAMAMSDRRRREGDQQSSVFFSALPSGRYRLGGHVVLAGNPTPDAVLRHTFPSTNDTWPGRVSGVFHGVLVALQDFPSGGDELMRCGVISMPRCRRPRDEASCSADARTFSWRSMSRQAGDVCANDARREVTCDGSGKSIVESSRSRTTSPLEHVVARGRCRGGVPGHTRRQHLATSRTGFAPRCRAVCSSPAVSSAPRSLSKISSGPPAY